MKKNLTEEQIIGTSLELIRHSASIRDVNLRQIARELGCAHTNLYNYFTSFDDLLWSLHIAVQQNFIQIITHELKQIQDTNLKLYQFFYTFLEIYLSNKGWFNLAWREYIAPDVPESNRLYTKQTMLTLSHLLEQIYTDLYHTVPDSKCLSHALHTIHCYIIGEVCNYLVGRSLYPTETELKTKVTEECVKLFRLYDLTKEGK